MTVAGVPRLLGELFLIKPKEKNKRQKKKKLQ